MEPENQLVDEPRRYGIVLAGIGGATGSTVAAGLRAMQCGLIPETYGVTSQSWCSELALAPSSHLVVAGWDVSPEPVLARAHAYQILPSEIPLSRLEEVELLPGVTGLLDARQLDTSVDEHLTSSIPDAVERLQNDIAHLRSRLNFEAGVLVYVGSPPRRPASSVRQADISSTSSEDIAGVDCYAQAALSSGLDFVDFTPSHALETDGILECFASANLQVAGRDGSTGQTYLKQAVIEALGPKGLTAKSWYSTNLIGNNDGRVLSLPGHAETKIHDKLSALGERRGDWAVDEHRVSIEYLPEWGDRKESWDAAEIAGWLGSSISLRINWRGQDSMLAAPLILDIARLLELGGRRGDTGFQEQLNPFFKFPIRDSGASLDHQWKALQTHYRS